MNYPHKEVVLFVGFPKKFKVIYKQKMVDLSLAPAPLRAVPCTTQKAMIKTIPLKYPPIVIIIIIIIIIIIRNVLFSLSGLTYPGTLFTIHYSILSRLEAEATLGICDALLLFLFLRSLLLLKK